VPEVVALVMAGGRSSRMRATAGPPHKVLTSVLECSLLERNLNAIIQCGVSSIAVAVNACETDLIAVVEEVGERLSLRCGVSVEPFVEDAPLGTIGAARCFKDRASALLVVNGDNLTTLDLRRFAAWHLERGAAMTIATHVQPFRIPFGEVIVHEDFVSSYAEKSVRQIRISSGAYVLSPAACGMIPAGRAVHVPELVASLLERGLPVGAFTHQAPWIDVNEASDIPRAEQLLRDHLDAFTCCTSSP